MLALFILNSSLIEGPINPTHLLNFCPAGPSRAPQFSLKHTLNKSTSPKPAFIASNADNTYIGRFHLLENTINIDASLMASITQLSLDFTLLSQKKCLGISHFRILGFHRFLNRTTIPIFAPPKANSNHGKTLVHPKIQSCPIFFSPRLS